MKLKDIQNSFQDALLNGNQEVLDHICDSKKEDRNVLFGVYSNAYVARLVEFLMNDYEKLHEFLGDEQFIELAEHYVAANPSQNTNGRWFGTKLPDFMAETEPYSDMTILIDLANFERALNDVFDAAEADILMLEDLGNLAPEDWSRLILKPQPSVTRLNLNTNALEIWSNLNDEEEIVEVCEFEEPDQIIVYREERMSRFRSMEYAEAMMWDQAVQGVPFSLLCEMMGTYCSEDEAPTMAAAYMQGWIVSGLLTNYELS